MAKDLVIVATPPVGQVTQIGSDYARGVWVEDASWDHSLPDHGARQAQFTLRRVPEQEWPDLSPFTPIQIHKAGSVVWTGRVQQTPTIRGRENEITVVCEGWPAHLKDDALERLFVHNDLTAWRDARAVGNNPAVYTGAYQVSSLDNGIITIQVPNGTTATNASIGGVMFDAGPYSTVKRIVVTYYGGGLANFALKYYGGDTATATTETGTIDATPIATGSTTFAWTYTTARRYTTIYMDVNATTAVATDTAWVSLANIICFADTAYESGNVSILKASQVIPVVLAYAPKVSQSTLGITTTAFDIPHLDGPVTNPADYIDAVNAYHSYQWFLRDGSDGGAPTMQFRSIPTAPTLVANVGSGIEFNDASRNDGSDIYNRVIVEYQDAAGNTAREERTTAGLSAAFADPDIAFDTTSTQQMSNPSFDTNTAGWVAGVGTITRDTGVFDSTPASGRMTSDGAGIISIDSPTISGLIPGRTYQLSYRVRAAAAWAAGTVSVFAFYSATSAVLVDSFTNAIGTSFTTRTVTFTARSSGTIYLNWASFAVSVGVDIIYVDTNVTREARPTIIDRQNFTRTRVLNTGSRLTAAAAQQIGDIYLQAHRFTPLRGTLTITGPALRTLLGDTPIPAHLISSRLLGDAVLINETHPDLGTIGRIGIINAASYNEPDDTAQVSIDTNRDWIDSLLARLAVFS